MEVPEHKKIQTQLGYINGRDTIYLENIENSLFPLQLKLLGEISGNGCSLEKWKNEFLKYELFFSSVAMYNCFELDYFPYKKQLKSSFDEIVNSEWLEKLQLTETHKHFVVSTYDHIFEIIAKEYDLKIL